jgi:quinohemoprotein ethanol dehydrogenase
MPEKQVSPALDARQAENSGRSPRFRYDRAQNENGGSDMFKARIATFGMLAIALPASAQDAAAARPARAEAIRRAPAFSAEQLLAPPGRDWLTNGGNLFNQRYSPLAKIDRDNVAGLKGVWRTHLDGSGLEPRYSGEATPIVHDGVIYISTGADDVFALSVASGEILWRYRADLDPDITTVCCGWTSRGVALGAGKVFIGQLDGRLVALDQRTGRPAWVTQAERWQDGLTITSAPLYYDGRVITGFAGADRGTRGRIKAYDADDGSLIWTFYTIPGPGEPGHETWPADSDVWQHGGASIWQTPAVDPELGLLYFSTANPGPDYSGAIRAGDNLYSSSIVALDAATGEYRWHFQEVHHDLWDYDASNPVLLFDVRIDGRMRRGIVEVGKTGFAYFLDRETGEPLIGIEERPVPQEPRQATAATQPYPLGESVVPQSVDVAPLGYELVNEGRIFTPFFGPEPVIARPSIWGGASWPPNAYDPVREMLFVCASDFPGTFSGGHIALEKPTHEESWGGGRVGYPRVPRVGQFVAMDVKTNTAAWRTQWPDQCYSGAAATGGGLVFTGRNDGRLIALDSDDGGLLWEFQTGAGLNSPASVFEHGGEQYVVVLSAGNTLIGSPRGDSVWLFGLNGTLEEALPGDTPLTPVLSTAADDLDAPDLERGADLYRQTCLPCHGEDGRGGHGGGAPLDSLHAVEQAAAIVREGRNNMPPFAAALTAQQILDVSAYVTKAFSAAP